MPNFFPSFSSLFRLRLPVASCPCFVQFPPSSATVPPFPFYCVRHLWLRYVPHPDRYLLCCMLPNRSLERCILLLSNPYRVFCWSVSYSYFYSCVCSKHLSPPPQTVRIVPTVMGHCHVLRLHSPPRPTLPGRTRRLRKQPQAEAQIVTAFASIVLNNNANGSTPTQYPFLSTVEHCVRSRRHRSLAFTFPFRFLMAVPRICLCVSGFPSFCLCLLRPP